MLEELSPGQIAITAILGVLAVAGLIGGEVGFAVLMGIIAAVYVNRQLEENRREAEAENALRDRRVQREQQRRQNDYYAPPDPFVDDQEDEVFAIDSRPANAEQVHKHALDAVRRVGLNPDKVQVLPVDLGFLTFRGDANPIIHRTVSLADDSDYIQPFVQLRLPVKAQGRIKFEIFDEHKQKVYAHEEKYQLERGRNLIIPATRLPVHDEQSMDGTWSLRISADGTTLAEHRFDWAETESDEFRRYLSDDGEISNEIRAMVVDTRLQNLSLDDLMAHQEDENQQMQGR
jgi:hypothetical protein